MGFAEVPLHLSPWHRELFGPGDEVRERMAREALEDDSEEVSHLDLQ
jgi:hypothetical protein